MPGPSQAACSRSLASRTSRNASLTSSLASRTASLAHAHSLLPLLQLLSFLSEPQPQPVLHPPSFIRLLPQPQSLLQPMPRPQLPPRPNSNSKMIQFICSPYLFLWYHMRRPLLLCRSAFNSRLMRAKVFSSPSSARRRSILSSFLAVFGWISLLALPCR